MNTVNLQMIGRVGNQMFQYAHARAYAEQNNLELRTPHWVGEWAFNISPTAPPCYEPGQHIISGYFQNQASLIYTRKQVREWFTLRDEVRDKLETICPVFDNVAHLRRGDYYGYGYVVVSADSYERKAKELGLETVHYASEETSCDGAYFRGDTRWLPDFYTMMQAKVLLRANSCFSWWAATLGHGKVYSPIVTGLQGGKEHDCEWVEGNWPRFCDLPNITDLHLQEDAILDIEPFCKP